MTDGMFCAKCLSQYQEILSKTRLFGTGKCSKLGRTLYSVVLLLAQDQACSSVTISSAEGLCLFKMTFSKLDITEILATISDMAYVKEVTVTNFYNCMCLYISSLIQSAYFLSLIEIVSLLSKQFNGLRHIFCCNMCFPTRYSNADMGAGYTFYSLSHTNLITLLTDMFTKLLHVFNDVRSNILRVNWFRCCPPRVGQLVKTTVTTAVIG